MPDAEGKQSRRLAALDALRGEGKGVRADASSLRLYVRDNFASLLSARKRDVSWQQITDVMAAAGVRSPDGSDLTWRKVAIFFHTERNQKEKDRQRKAERADAKPRRAKNGFGPLAILPEAEPDPAEAQPRRQPRRPPRSHRPATPRTRTRTWTGTARKRAVA